MVAESPWAHFCTQFGGWAQKRSNFCLCCKQNFSKMVQAFMGSSVLGVDDFDEIQETDCKNEKEFID